MGLSIWPLIADLVLQGIEETFLIRYKKSITCYYRYVEDSFIVIMKNKLSMLLNYWNNFHERLKCTFEKEGEKLEKNSINFLDILIKRNFDGTVCLDLYNKPTFSGRYVNFLSNHSIAIKKGIVKNLIQKIFNSSDP